MDVTADLLLPQVISLNAGVEGLAAHQHEEAWLSLLSGTKLWHVASDDSEVARGPLLVSSNAPLLSSPAACRPAGLPACLPACRFACLPVRLPARLPAV